MISLATARRLRDGGLRWTPGTGDRFVVPDRDMDDEVFVLSTMTVELQHYAEGDAIGFNGTTEWALDSVDESEALWLPRETQLRELLGSTFVGFGPAEPGWRVTLRVSGRAVAITDEDAEEAYARALLHLVVGDDGGVAPS